MIGHSLYDILIPPEAPNNKTYSITCTDGAQFSQAQDSEEEEESPPAHRRNIKSADPGTVPSGPINITKPFTSCPKLCFAHS